MAIDFTLTSTQQILQRNAREFAMEILQPLVKAADEEPDTQKAFQAVKGAYVECYKLGFATAFLPKQYGGGGVSNVDLQIVAEESRRLTQDSPPFFSSMAWRLCRSRGLVRKSRSGNGSGKPPATPPARISPGGL